MKKLKDHGLNELKKLLRIFKKMSKKEYIKLFNKAKGELK